MLTRTQTLALAVCVAVAACGSPSSALRPVASIPTSREADAAFAPLREAWSADPKARIALQPRLVAFLARFPSDGVTPLVRTYLALALLDMNDMDEADRQLTRLGTLPAGATADLADVARAKLLRLRGHPDLAFERLRPLVGKVVDPVSRAVLQEEVSLAAIAAKREYEAIAYMDAWLRNASDEDHEAVRAKVTAALEKEPEAVLENALRAMRSGGAASGYGREIQRLVTERLGALALTRGDSDLARWLVAGESNAPLPGGEEGALGELATTKRGLATVEGRTIGLVLPTGSTDLRDEAAAIMRGVAWALDLPRPDPSQGDQTKLATRDDGGDASRVEPTMSELAGEGAVVILAALDPVSADHAVRWGEEHGVAVITFATPSASVARQWAFVAGVPQEAEIGALGEELVSHGAVRIVPIVPPSGSAAVQALSKGSVQLEPAVACDTAAAQSGEAHFPVDAWKKDRVRSWLVDAPSECARDLIRELGAASIEGTVTLTLDAAGTDARARGVKALAVHAGIIPLVAASPDGVTDADARAWYTREGAPPNWWAALGHDAAALARRAVSALPLDATSDAREVSRRRAAAKDALGAARAKLWTTDAPGFSGAHAMPRDLHVVELATPRGATSEH